jgi:hypothetical protein
MNACYGGWYYRADMGVEGIARMRDKEVTPAYLLRSLVWMVSVILGAILLAAAIILILVYSFIWIFPPPVHD